MSTSSSAYRTKTIIEPKNNKSIANFWPVAIDVGYSSVKCFSPNIVAQFPSFALRADNHGTIGEVPKSYLLYTDLETGEKWLVGKSAQEELSGRSTTSSDTVLFGRNRYYDPVFQVCVRTGLGLSMTRNHIAAPGNRVLKVMTGLPPTFMQEDAPALREAFNGRHHFSLQMGNKPAVSYDFTINAESDVMIVPQPFGTLYALALDNNGRVPEGRQDYLSKNILVFDCGQLTTDLFEIRHHSLGASETFVDCGMYQVMKNTIDRIYNMYGVRYPVTAFQSCLEKGSITVFNRRSRSSTEYPITDILLEESEKVCKKALDLTMDIFNPAEYDYFVITGGTSEAWKEIIRKEFSGIKTLSLVDGNVNDPSLPMSFSNVRGYYYSLLSSLSRQNS